MGNTFTMYTGNNHFDIVTTSDLYAFALVGLSSQITTTANGDWVASSEGTSDSKYNYIFRYQPSATRTAATFASPGSWVFTLDSGSIPSSTVVHWVNGTTSSYDGDENSSTPFSAVTYNIEASSSDAGSGGGDVHVVPLFNPEHKIYMLPTNNKIYKYFDNRDPYQRVVVNSKMWVLDNKFIYIIDHLKNKNSDLCAEASGKKQVTKYVLSCDDEPSKIDTSFVKYISFMVKTNDHCDMVVFDMETLLPVKYDKSKVDNYSLEERSIENIDLTYINISDIKPLKRRLHNYKKNVTSEEGNYYRSVTINTNKHGKIIFNLVRLPNRVNHRNHVELKLYEPHKLNLYNCCGTLIKINQTETVPSLCHINSNPNSVYINNEKFLDTAEWRLRRSKIIKTQRVRKKRKIAQTGKGELDFYSLVNEDPEREYYKYISFFDKRKIEHSSQVRPAPFFDKRKIEFVRKAHFTEFAQRKN